MQDEFYFSVLSRIFMSKEWQAGLHRIGVNPSEISRQDLLLNEKKDVYAFFMFWFCVWCS